MLDFEKYKNTIPYPEDVISIASLNIPPFLADTATAKEAVARVEVAISNRKMLMEARDKRGAELHAEFERDALECVWLTGHPCAQRAMGYAYDKGHAYGYEEICSCLRDIAYVILGK